MARTLRFVITMEVSLNESDLALLRLIEQRTAGSSSPRNLTARTLAEGLHMSLATARRSCRNLADKGLVTMSRRMREDGGRDANAFEVTRLGFAVLRSEGTLRPRRVAPGDPLPPVGD